LNNTKVLQKYYIAKSNGKANSHNPKEVNIVRIGHYYYHILKYKDGSLAFKNDPGDFYKDEEHFHFVHYGRDF